MKKYFASKILIALAVAIAAATGYESMANEQPISPPAGSGALPDNIQPGSPVAQVIKLAQAGVDVSVIQTYIANCPGAFNLDADKIIFLTDAGISSNLVSAMFAHDKTFLASLPSAAPPAPAPTQTASADNSAPTAPPAEMTVDDFNTALAPYGQWIVIDGYGRCWRPTLAAYDATWQPYCDRGQWVYTDCGWYWNSDYSWGITFHYGRWFNAPNYGWCWWPDTVWAPSWVTWRTSNDYCGWAPLPPYTAYQPGIGFTYHGGGVSVDFGFGLAANCFTFVSIGHFCDPHPRNYCVPRQQVTQIYNQTTIINNYNSHNRTIVNNGVSVTVIGAAAHHPIQAVGVGTLVNAERHGWRGQGEIRPTRPFGSNTSDGSTTRQFTGTGLHQEGTVQNPAATANNSLTVHSQPQNNNLSSGENHQVERPYTPPSMVIGAPVNHSSAAANQYQQPRSDVRQSPRQVSEQPSFITPAAAVEQSQHAQQRQNYNLAAPRTGAPVQAQNVSPNNGGRSQNWFVQNH